MYIYIYIYIYIYMYIFCNIWDTSHIIFYLCFKECLMMIRINQNIYHQNKRYKKVMCWAEQCIVIWFSAAIENTDGKHISASEVAEVGCSRRENHENKRKFLDYKNISTYFRVRRRWSCDQIWVFTDHELLIFVLSTWKIVLILLWSN
jgi:hypothetical protein